LKIRIDRIKEKPLELDEELNLSEFPALAATGEAGEVTFTGPVRVIVKAEREFDHIRVAGEVMTAMTVTCARCLFEFEKLVRTSFLIFYRKDDGRPLDEEVELTEKELSAVSYRGDEIDLNPEIEDQLVMEIPMKSLCSDDCRGLCAACGADLNREACRCIASVNPKFAALKDFRPKK